MDTINGFPFHFDDVPLSWAHCFCNGCPKHEGCMRYQTGMRIPDSLQAGAAIYPTAYSSGSCKYYKAIRVIHSAYGFRQLFRNVKQVDYTPLRQEMKQFLGSHGAYYRYNRGERLLTPEQQQWILRLFDRYGYKTGLAFDHYRDVFDFS